MKIEIEVPDDSTEWVLSDIASGLLAKADHYRSDKGHDPEDVVKLQAYADLLDQIVSDLDDRAARLRATTKGQ